MLRVLQLLAQLLKLLFQFSFRSGQSLRVIDNGLDMVLRSLRDTLPYLADTIKRRVNAPQHHLGSAIVNVLRRELVRAASPEVHHKHPEISQVGRG